MFEGQGESGGARSPDGRFEFGLTGFVFAGPIPESITFFLDNTCMVTDQYGRPIVRATSMEGTEVRFAPTSPVPKEGGGFDFNPRPEYATHQQTIEALRFEGIDWLAYKVRYRDLSGKTVVGGRTTLDVAKKFYDTMVKRGISQIQLLRAVVSSGWPQLPYDELKKLPELPPTPVEELQKIRDKQLRQDALRIRREYDTVRAQELVAAEE